MSINGHFSWILNTENCAQETKTLAKDPMTA